MNFRGWGGNPDRGLDFEELALLEELAQGTVKGLSGSKDFAET